MLFPKTIRQKSLTNLKTKKKDINLTAANVVSDWIVYKYYTHTHTYMRHTCTMGDPCTYYRIHTQLRVIIIF